MTFGAGYLRRCNHRNIMKVLREILVRFVVSVVVIVFIIATTRYCSHKPIITSGYRTVK